MSNQRFIAVNGQWVDGVGREGLINVYAPIEGKERATSFEEVSHFVNQWECYSLAVFRDLMVFMYRMRDGVYIFWLSFEQFCGIIGGIGASGSSSCRFIVYFL